MEYVFACTKTSECKHLTKFGSQIWTSNYTNIPRHQKCSKMLQAGYCISFLQLLLPCQITCHFVSHLQDSHPQQEDPYACLHRNKTVFLGLMKLNRYAKRYAPRVRTRKSLSTFKLLLWNCFFVLWTPALSWWSMGERKSYVFLLSYLQPLAHESSCQLQWSPLAGSHRFHRDEKGLRHTQLRPPALLPFGLPRMQTKERNRSRCLHKQAHCHIAAASSQVIIKFIKNQLGRKIISHLVWLL